MEVVKGEKCIGEVVVGFPGSGFRTVLEALPSDEVEDSSSDTPVGLAVDYGGDLPLLFVVNDDRWREVWLLPGVCVGNRGFQEGDVKYVVYGPQGVGESQSASVCRDDLGNREGA